MSRQCELSEKNGMVGNRVSHAKNRTKVRLLANVQSKRIYSKNLKKFVRIKLCTKALRSVNKMGIDAYCAKLGISLS